jgi:hypothetical protein
MEQLSLQIPVGAPLNLLSLLINLGVGIVLALLLRWHFERFGSTLSNRWEFAQTFPFILLTTVLVITVVKSSLALSLGLVGALSIVRFRTPVKEPEELAYLFLAIAMGLGLGADQTLPTVVAALSILVVMAALRWARSGPDQTNLYLSIDMPDAGQPGGRIDQLSQVISRHAQASDLRRLDARNEGLEVTYFVDLEEPRRLSELLEELSRTFPGIGVSFIDQNQMPSV